MLDAVREVLFCCWSRYSPHGVSWAAEFFDPAEFDDYADVTDRMRAILEPPNARHPGRSTTPRFQSEARL